MKQLILQEKFPVFVLDLPKTETTHRTVDDVIAALRAQIDANPKVAFLGVFDHYAHTRDIGGDIAPDIAEAKNLMFCFGFALPDPKVMAVRPRSIGVADLGDHFVISFMEAPMPPANAAMESWAKALRNA